jgi:signal transduction histidine kinase
VRVAAHREGDTVILQVADNGRGVPADVMPRLFEPFFTTRRGHGGTGLGLTIVHRIATQTLAGSVAVEAAVPRGTVFTVRFPRQRPDVRPATR